VQVVTQLLEKHKLQLMFVPLVLVDVTRLLEKHKQQQPFVKLVKVDDTVQLLLLRKHRIVRVHDVMQVVTPLLEKHKYLWLRVITNVVQANGL
jgi:hypothetical protein